MHDIFTLVQKTESAKLLALRALVPYVPRALHALVLHAPWAACALVPCALRALLLCVSSVLHALMLHIPRTYMLFC